MLQISSAKMKTMKYGYARMSTDDQTTALQLAALKKVGCKTVFKDEGLCQPSSYWTSRRLMANS